MGTVCRVCSDDTSVFVWCDPCWAVVKAKALVAPARPDKRTKVNAALKPALGLEAEGSVPVAFSAWGVLCFTFTV